MLVAVTPKYMAASKRSPMRQCSEPGMRNVMELIIIGMSTMLGSIEYLVFHVGDPSKHLNLIEN